MVTTMYYCPVCHELSSYMDEYTQQEICHHRKINSIIEMYDIISERHIKSKCIICDAELVKPAKFYIVRILNSDSNKYIDADDITRVENDG